mmetsp:Transcript_123390/g.356674  ORF Transcript_123390/g.356674 Transcript_123390/m.356674 type:complete len:676 (-) Transcript_123390:86-2113(-)
MRGRALLLALLPQHLVTARLRPRRSGSAASVLQDDAAGLWGLGTARLRRDEVGLGNALSATSISSVSSSSDDSSSGKPEGAWASARLASGAAEVVGTSSTLGVTKDDAGNFVLRPVDSTGGASMAWGTFSDSLPDMGWSGLSMSTSDSGASSDGERMYAAGLVEGFLTANRIREFHHNSRALVEMNPENRESLPQLERALAKMVSELAGPEGDFTTQSGSNFDTQARLALLQTWGVRDGYQLAIQNGVEAVAGMKPLSMVDMFILNSDGVIDELLSKYGSAGSGSLLQRSSARGRAAPRSGSRKQEVAQNRHRRRSLGHCTGLVRLSEDKSDIFFGHTTWEPFSEMTRVWKVYDFPLQGAAARKISFSSYPGCVSSTDDYYLMDSGLAITETTLSIPRQQEYPSGGRWPDFLRIMGANRVASTGDEWARAMADSATGTYSSQWLILDYKRFTPGADLPAGTFTILEQAPGVDHIEDMSATLQRDGYWADFDRAYFDDVRERTGDASMVERSKRSAKFAEAEIYSKDMTPRAQIARSTAKNVNSLAAMREEMSSNHGTHEPVDQPSLRNPRYAISARDDLQDEQQNDPDGSPDGGVDAKVTNRCLFQQLAANALSGPSHTSLPAFRWTTADGSETWPGFPHEGLPNVADFSWVRAAPPPAAGASVLSPLDAGDSCQ